MKHATLSISAPAAWVALVALAAALALASVVAACDDELDGDEHHRKPTFSGGTVSGGGEDGTSTSPAPDGGRSSADAQVGKGDSGPPADAEADAADNDAQDQ